MPDFTSTVAKGKTDATTGQDKGKDKLERLKALAFPPATRLERTKLALEALQKVIKASPLDVAVIKCLAEDKNLEGV